MSRALGYRLWDGEGFGARCSRSVEGFLKKNIH